MDCADDRSAKVGDYKMKNKIRVQVSKPGCDGHWRGIVTVSRGLRDAGMEVIFAGFQNVEEIVKTAIEEDVDVIGLSIHSGAHIQWTRQVFDLLKEKGVQNEFILLVGGPIPEEDVQELKSMGATGIFRPATEMGEIVDCIKQNVYKDINDRLT